MKGKDTFIKIAEGVRFDRWTGELYIMACAYWLECEKQGVIGWITGAQNASYRHGSAHRDGRALDFRSRDLKDPGEAAQGMRSTLKAYGLEATVLQGPPDHLDHIHAHYAPRGGE
jgi:hypothetical protein